MVLQIIRPISISDGEPVILFPLTFLISMSAIKDYIEDYKRKKQDKLENNMECMVFDATLNKFVTRKWKEVIVG